MEYPPASYGNAAPAATITGIPAPRALGLDGAGNLLVASSNGAIGAPAPINTIFGPDTGLASPQALVVDGLNRLSVANAGGTVTVYPFGATLDATPSATVSAGLQAPYGIDRDTDLTLYVGDVDLNAILESGPYSLGPSYTITTRLPSARRGRRYLVNLRAAEGTTPYRWQKARGHLARAGSRLRLDRRWSMADTRCSNAA